MALSNESIVEILLFSCRYWHISTIPDERLRLLSQQLFLVGFNSVHINTFWFGRSFLLGHAKQSAIHWNHHAQNENDKKWGPGYNNSFLTDGHLVIHETLTIFKVPIRIWSVGWTKVMRWVRVMIVWVGSSCMRFMSWVGIRVGIMSYINILAVIHRTGVSTK